MNPPQPTGKQPSPLTKSMLVAFARLNAAVYRISGGRLMNKFGNSDICVVRMTGARSGTQRDVR
jgi:hypothetical protein